MECGFILTVHRLRVTNHDAEVQNGVYWHPPKRCKLGTHRGSVARQAVAVSPRFVYHGYLRQGLRCIDLVYVEWQVLP
eukprot:2840779-Pleurochrysis_carterae.AAC.2